MLNHVTGFMTPPFAGAVHKFDSGLETLATRTFSQNEAMTRQRSRLRVNAGDGAASCLFRANDPTTGPARNLAISTIFTLAGRRQAIITATFDPGDPR